MTPTPGEIPALHEQIVQGSGCLIVAFDPNGTVRLFNPAAEKLTGYGREEVLGRNWFETFIPPSGRGQERNAVERMLLGEEPERRDRVIRTREGERWIRWQMSCAHDSHGQPRIVYGVGFDITDEHSLRRRTRLAERLALAGTLAAGLAHEIRNPLNSASLQLKLLRRRLEGATATKCDPPVSAIELEIARLGELVNDFLAYARPHALERTSTDLGELCRDALNAITPGRGITVAVKVEGDTTVPVDTEKLRQVLINLMRNGIEAMPGGGTLSVRVRPVPSGAEVKIEDTGAGIPVGARLFEAFYTTKPQGTGLGLAIVQRIVEDHGGSVSCDSAEGTTTFTVYLPHPAA